MAADSDGGGVIAVDDARLRACCAVETVVITCVGDLHDPEFPGTFRNVLSGLRGLLCNGSEERLRVRKVEPWNSVRVTFTIPAQAAQRLRALAQGGDPTLARLGILSVQLQPDQVISVRVGRGSVPGGGGSGAGSGAANGAAEQVVRSPNVVAPPAPAPVLPPPTAPPPAPPPPKPQVFPFASMTHAAREAQVSGHYPPPPYPGGGTPSGSGGGGGQASPLLVNLLQTESSAPQVPNNHPHPTGGAVRLKGSDGGGTTGSAFAQVRPRYAPPPAYRPPTAALPPNKEEDKKEEGGKRRQMLINPLTGVLEPMSSSSSSSSEEDDDVSERERRNRRSHNALSPPLRSDDESESKSSEPQEKIKLRLKIEKPQETVVTSVGYKVDFVKSGAVGANVPTLSPQEEPRVPPLHISLRGRNAAVVVGSRKEKKRESKNRGKTRKVDGDPGSCCEDEEPSCVSAPSSAPLAILPPARNNFPSEAEVASILRSMPPTTNAHKLLDNEDKKKRESKKRLYPRERGLVAARAEEKRGRKSSSGSTTSSSSCHVGSSLLKSVVKSAAKEARLLSAAARLKSASANGGYQGSQMLKGAGEYRPKVNCVYGPKSNSNDASSRFNASVALPKKPSDVITTVGCVAVASDNVTPKNIGLPVTELDVSETKLKARLLGDEKETNTKEGGTSGGGEDSGIESMDALSEKSPNQSESPSGKDDPPVGTNKCEKRPPEAETKVEGVVTTPGGGGSSSPEEVVPVRLTPALYTYSNPERAQQLRDETPSPPPNHHDPEAFSPRPARSSNAAVHGSNTAAPGSNAAAHSSSNTASSSSQTKSLLEQLLIEIPGDSPSERRPPRSTRSSHLNRLHEGASPGKRVRKASESSAEDPPTPRPSKRKCSENAAELIKACMGLEESGKRDVVSPAVPKQRKDGESETSEDESEKGARSKSDDTPSSRLKAKEEEASRSSPRRVTVGQRRPPNVLNPQPLLHSPSLKPGKSGTSPAPQVPPPVVRESQRRKTRSLVSSGEECNRKRRRSSRDSK